MFSFFKKSSILDPRFFLLIAQLLLAFARQRQVILGRGPRFLDESVQCHQTLVVKANQHARRPLAGRVCSHFPQTLAHRATQGHSDWPTPLRPQEIGPDGAPFYSVQPLQPFADRFAAGIVAEEYKLDLSGCFSRHRGSNALRLVYHKKYAKKINRTDLKRIACSMLKSGEAGKE